MYYFCKMKQILLTLSLLLLAVSCGKNGTDGLYISVQDSCWEITANDQVGWPCYIGREKVSVLMYSSSTGYFQTLNGTYTVDGHRVDVTADDNAIRMVRTFSHLKNSSNKNYTRLSPEAPASMSGSLWANMKDNDLHFSYYREDGTLLTGTYANVIHKEGIASGWSFGTEEYSVTGNQYSDASHKGVIYGSKFMVLEDYAVPCVSIPERMEGTSSLKGTLWLLNSTAYPGFILFTSATEFVRVLVASGVYFQTLKGTYSLKGNSLEFKTDSEELNKTCTINREEGKFTYLDRTYSWENMALALGQ